ncbi:MAG: hypothetical protein ACREBC_39500, partial [Pyrinomonadaceae bacterium]
ARELSSSGVSSTTIDVRTALLAIGHRLKQGKKRLEWNLDSQPQWLQETDSGHHADLRSL